MSTDLAHLLRSHHHLLRRELDFYLAVDPSLPSTDPLDRIMIRGRVDATLITPEGLTLIDYKTDRLTPDQAPARADLYKPQVTLYRRALEQITRRPVTAVHLVFLTPRRIVGL
jgi:ATP-dependent helicase/nuclease subunit A